MAKKIYGIWKSNCADWHEDLVEVMLDPMCETKEQAACILQEFANGIDAKWVVSNLPDCPHDGDENNIKAFEAKVQESETGDLYVSVIVHTKCHRTALGVRGHQTTLYTPFCTKEYTLLTQDGRK